MLPLFKNNIADLRQDTEINSVSRHQNPCETPLLDNERSLRYDFRIGLPSGITTRPKVSFVTSAKAA